jgi:hypothetical protein
MENEYPNSGVLFAAKAKKSPKAPDYYGDFLLDLSTVKVRPDNKVEFKLSGWKKESKAGKTYLSLSVNTYEKEEDRSQDPDNDIPF